MRYALVLFFLPFCAGQQLSPGTPISKLAVDSNGNIYAAQGATITRLNQWTATVPFAVLGMNVVASGTLVAVGAGSMAVLDVAAGRIQSTTSFPVPAGVIPKSMAITSAGNIVISGEGGPLTAGALNIPGGQGFWPGNLIKLDPTGRVLWAAQGVGGVVAVDSSENVYVAGSSQNAMFPTTANAYQPTAAFTVCTSSVAFEFPCLQQFIAKVSPDGSTLQFSTYLTGKLGATPLDIALGPDESIYTVGSVQAPDYPVTGGAPVGIFPAQFVNSLCSCQELSQAYATSGFVSRMSGDGTKLLYSTFLGGSQWDFSSTIAVGKDGSMAVGGVSISPDFPALPQQLDSCRPGSSLLIEKQRDFLASISPDGSSILGAQLIGGTNPGAGIACITDAADGSFADTVSPGQLITINGLGVGPAVSEIPGIASPAVAIGGVSAAFDGIAAPITAAGGTIVTVGVPFAVAGTQQTTLTLVQNGQTFDSRQLGFITSAATMFVLPPATKACDAAPQAQWGSFVGGSPMPVPMILNADGSINACDNPAPLGSMVTFYLNGLGAGTPQLMINGQVVNAIPIGSQTSVSSVSFQLPASSSGPFIFQVVDQMKILPDYQPNYGVPVYVK